MFEDGFGDVSGDEEFPDTRHPDEIVQEWMNKENEKLATKAQRRKLKKALEKSRRSLQEFSDWSAKVLTESALRGLDNFLESAHNRRKENSMAMKKTAPKGKVLALVCKCRDCSHWELLLDKTGDYTQTLLKCVSCGDTHPVSFEIDAHENLHYKKV